MYYKPKLPLMKFIVAPGLLAPHNTQAGESAPINDGNNDAEPEMLDLTAAGRSAETPFSTTCGPQEEAFATPDRHSVTPVQLDHAF